MIKLKPEMVHAIWRTLMIQHNNAAALAEYLDTKAVEVPKMSWTE